MIKDGSYREFAGQMIGDMQDGQRLHGGNFANLLFHDDGYNAARVYREASERFGPFATAAAFAAQCDWNTAEDGRQFAEEHQEWPPRKVAEEFSYL